MFINSMLEPKWPEHERSEDSMKFPIAMLS